MKKIQIKAKFSPPKLRLALGKMLSATAPERGKGYDIPIDVPGITPVSFRLPETIDPDSAVGQQLSSVVGHDIAEGFDLTETEGKEVVALLVPKRSSGGKYGYSVEAILAPQIVTKAAETVRGGTAHATSRELSTETR